MEEDSRGNWRRPREQEGPLGGFAGWLRQRRIAPDKQIPFFVRWVERFLRLSRTRPRDVWRDTLQVFLEDLAEGHAPDWRIRQAADAVSLYCGQFRPSSVRLLAERTEASSVQYRRSLAQVPRGRPGMGMAGCFPLGENDH